MPRHLAAVAVLALGLSNAAAAQLYRPMPGQLPAIVSGIPEGRSANVIGNLTLNGALRSRFDALDRQYRNTGPVSDSMLSTRTMIFGAYDAGRIQLGFELMDSRGYPRQPNSTIGTGEINAMEVVQLHATAELGDMLGDGSDTELTVGRLVMDVGSRRLIGKKQIRVSDISGRNAGYKHLYYIPYIAYGPSSTHSGHHNIESISSDVKSLIRLTAGPSLT